MPDNRINLNLTNWSEALNGHFAPINFIKGTTGLESNTTRFSTCLGANGVPATSPPNAAIATTLNVPPTYVGNYVLKWTGTQTFQVDIDVAITLVSDTGGWTAGSSFISGHLIVSGTNGKVVFNTPGTSGSWRLTYLAGTFTTPGCPALMFAANETAYDAGELFNPDYITRLKALNPKSLRVMQTCGPTLFSQPLTFGRPQDYFSWAGSFYPPNLYAGDISSSNGTTFVCSAAPSTAGSITEGEMIYGWCTATNTGAVTLNIGGRGAKSVWNQDTGANLIGGELVSGQLIAFTYDLILDIYWWNTTGQFGFPTTGAPLSVVVALANKVGCGLWYTFPVMTKLSEFRAICDYVRDNLVGTFWTEFANETWGGSPPFPSGALVAWSHVLFPSDVGYGNPLALRTRQMNGAATDSWNAASRPLSTLKRVIASFDGTDPAGFLVYMEGPNLASYGYSTAPNRPIDFMDVLALNTYIDGPSTPAVDFPNVPGNNSGYVTPGQEGLYTAADNYANGVATSNATLIASALDWVDNDLRQGTGGNGNIFGTITWKLANIWASFETAATSYDTARIGAGMLPIELAVYEGGIQINGPSVGTLNTLGLNGALYGGPTGRIQTLFNAYKNDARFKQISLDLFSNFMTKSHATTPGWFVFAGSQSQWDVYPTDIYSTPFKSYDAIVQWDSARSVPHLRFRLHA